MSTDPTTCTCEGDVVWNEGTPRWIALTDPDCPEHHEEDDQ